MSPPTVEYDRTGTMCVEPGDMHTPCADEMPDAKGLFWEQTQSKIQQQSPFLPLFLFGLVHGSSAQEAV